MSRLLTDEEILGQAPAKEPSALESVGGWIKGQFGIKPEPKGLLSDEDIIRGVKVRGAEPDTAWQGAKNIASDLRTHLGNAMQLPGAAADMIVGAPANLVGRVKGTGAEVATLLGGGTKPEAEAANREAQNLGWMESFKTPFQSAVKSLTGAEHYDQAIVEKAFEYLGEKGSAAAGGKLTPHDITNAIGYAMDLAGVKGVAMGTKAAYARGLKKVTDAAWEARKAKDAEAPPRVAEDLEIDATGMPKGTDPVAWAKQQEAIVKAREKAAAELTPDVKFVKDLFKQAKSPEAQVDLLFEAARKGRLKPVETPLAVEPELGAAAGTVPKTRLTEGRVIGEEAPTPISPELDSAMEKISAGGRATLSAEERIALQEVAQSAGILDAEGRPISSRQGGFTTPEALKILGAFSIGGAAAYYVVRNHRDLVDAAVERVQKALGIKTYKERLEENDREWKDLNDRQFPGMDGGELAGAESSDLVGPLAVGMAVKGKGGMWHPEAVGRLSRSIAPRMGQGEINDLTNLREHLKRGSKDLTDADNLELSPTYKRLSLKNAMQTWSDTAVQRYLNKWAGTTEDPLKDVMVPFEEGMKRWEELTDQALSAKKASTLKAEARIGTRFESEIPESIRKAPDEEAIWSSDYRNQDTSRARNRASDAARALESYLSHAGDFARQNIKPEDLGRYDLVRLIKETAAHDAKMEKLAERAAADSTAQLPVYRDYPEGKNPGSLPGMKWVELKLPEKLTEEQAKGVQKKTYEDKPTDHYVALDTQGKPIRNSYTEEIATGRTPEEAFLAGRLAEEGNALGHCVGGYCDAVASGESKIYSLRDAKGKSHVTVEVSPPDVRVPHNSPEHFARMKGGELLERYNEAKKGMNEVPLNREIIQSPEFQQWIRSNPGDILQIKGKANRAPVEAYRPYVQDFVRGGKWGEVRDLENSGLTRIDPELARSGGKLEGKRFVTSEELSQALDEGDYQPNAPRATRQQGSADPRLLAAIAAAGGIAAYLAAHPEDGEKLAAAGVLGATRGRVFKAIKEAAREVDKTVGRSTTRLANIDPEVRRSTRDMELSAGKAIAEASERISTFIDAAKTLPKEQQAELQSAYLANEPGRVAEAIKGNVPLVTAYRELRGFLDKTRDTLEGFGRFKKGITDYLPRVVKDLDGLMEALGQENRTGLQKLLADANTKMLKERKRDLTEVEQSVIVNNWLKSEPSISHLPGFAKSRRVEMEAKLEPFYYDMEGSLVRYAHAAVEDIATAKFFGKDLRVSKSSGKAFTDVEESIGALTLRLQNEGRITPEQAVEMQEILRARFGPGEKAPMGWVQDVRNLTGAATLGQIGSGIVQTSETLLSTYHHGIVPALRSVGTLLAGKGITPKEFGLANHVIEETIGKRPTGQLLSGILKLNLLAAFDQLGMRQNLTASFIKNKSLANTPGGRATLEAKWGKDYGGDLPQLIKELQESTPQKRTPLVDSLLYQELSDVRPTSRMEAPQRYNENPNLRLAYQLKMFMLTQADILRRDAYNKIKTGDPAEIARGFKNLAVFGGALAVVSMPSDMVKNWIMGRPVDLANTDYLDNVARNFGLSRYGFDKVATSDKPISAAAEVAGSAVTPPVVSVTGQLAKGLDEPKKLVPFVPLVGRAIYNRELGGNESWKKQQATIKRIKARDAAERDNPMLKERRLARKRAKEKRALEKLQRVQ